MLEAEERILPKNVKIWLETKDGLVFELESVTYNLVREQAPIYTIGNPGPRAFSRGERYMSGYFRFNATHRDDIMRQDVFDIHILYDDTKIKLDDVKVMSCQYINISEKTYECTFISYGAKNEVIEKLEGMSNKQLAVRLLSKEY